VTLVHVTLQLCLLMRCTLLLMPPLLLLLLCSPTLHQRLLWLE
jgi:hypothetical protein